MYLKSFKIKYPEPSYAFLGKELVPYLEKHPTDAEAELLERYIIDGA